MRSDRLLLLALFTGIPLLLLSARAAALIRTPGDYWREFEQAAQLKEKGLIDEAIPLWAELSDASAEMTAVRDYKNAGLFAKWLAHALDERGRFEEARRWYAKELIYFDLAGVPDWEQGDRARLAALRTDLQVFVTRQEVTAAPRAKFEPANGAYLGLYLEGEPPFRRPGGPPAYGSVSSYFGKKHALFLIYAHWGQPFPMEDALAIKEAGAAVQISLEPDAPEGLAAVRDDSWLEEWVKAAASLQIPVFLRFAPEMNGDWVSWHRDPPLYVEKWRLVARVVRRLAPNVALVWTPFFVGDSSIPIERYYPGDQYVDWVGVNFYSDYYFNRQTPAADVPPFQHLEEIYDKFAARKPIMIAEFGIANRDYRFGPGNAEDVTDWAALQLRSFYAHLPQLFPRVKALVYWSVDQAVTRNPTGREIIRSSYLLSEKPEVLAAYREAIASDYYLSEVTDRQGAAQVTSYRPAAYTTLRAGVEELSAYVKGRTPIESRVTYFVNTHEVGSSAIPPFNVRYDFAPYAGRTVLLEARAEDTAGREFARFSARIPVSGGSAAAFPDLAGHWARSLVTDLARDGIVNGYEDGNFRPEERITRAAFVKLILAAAGRFPDGTPAPYFLDVPEDHWFYPWAAKAVTDGVLRLGDYPDRRFEPSTPVTRLEMAVFAARLLNHDQDGSEWTTFRDEEKIPAALRSAVAAAVADGIMSGYPDASFRPEATATRAEAAAVAQRLRARLGKTR